MSSMKSFDQLGLDPALLSAISELGYETPTPVQEQSIPILLQGDDLLAQAQPGNGKTAAFALPILAQLDVTIKKPQALILAPTRELAIQVAEAFQSYARHLKGFNVTPIYGGQDYRIQLRALKRGAHVIVGTPGRLMDQLRRGSLSIDALKMVVLDEADEMLNMGFIDDIAWILEQIKHQHQTALFSATLPASIRKIAKRYLHDAKKVEITPKESTVEAIEQCYMCIAQSQKLEALTRFLEVEDIQGVIVFVRTKNSSAELAGKLQARGYAAAALNGDMNQSLREKVVARIKKGTLDIIVATGVAARGIDVERISHVINFDIPSDIEAYIHRIGRTGRAGRKGKALLFVTPRERRLLKDIERVMHQAIKQIDPPSLQEMTEKRSKQLAEKIINIVEKSKKLGPHHKMIERIIEQGGCEPKDIAAALVYLLQESNPLPSSEVVGSEEGGRKRRRQPHPARRKSSNGSGRGSSARSGERSSKRFGRKSSERSGERSSERSGERSSKRFGRKSSERSGERSSERSGRKSSERSGGRSSERSGRKSSERSGERSSERSGRKSSERSGKKSSDQPRKKKRASGDSKRPHGKRKPKKK